MNTISLKLEQVKKGKNGTTLVNLTTKSIEVTDTKKAVEICVNLLEKIGNSLKLASEMGQSSVKVGGVNFSLKGKFSIYVVIDGQEFNADEISEEFLHIDKTLSSFRNPQALFVQMYRIIRMANGQSVFLTQEANKVLSNTQKLLS